MASDSEGDEFLGFETEEVERARASRRQLSDESDISVSDSESESSSESESEEDIDERWTIDNSPVHVEEFVERTGPTSRVPEDGTALDFFLLLWPEDLFEKIVEETNRTYIHTYIHSLFDK